MSISTLLLVAALAQSTAPSSSPESRTSEADMAAAAFAEGFGVSLEEARNRIEAGEATGQYVESLRERYKSRLTFISIEQVPDQHIVVGLKGPQMVPTQRMSDEGVTVRVEFEEGYPYDEAEFTAIVENSLKEAKKLIPGITGMEGKPDLGIVRIHVQDHSDTGHSDAAIKLGQMFGVRFEIVYGKARSSKAANTRGGAILPEELMGKLPLRPIGLPQSEFLGESFRLNATANQLGVQCARDCYRQTERPGSSIDEDQLVGGGRC